MTAPQPESVRPERRDHNLDDRQKLENIESDIDELTDRHDALARQQADLAARFAEAFPGGDHVGHCRYHELMIEAIEGRKRLREAVMEKTVAGLVWAFMLVVGAAILNYLRLLFTGKV